MKYKITLFTILFFGIMNSQNLVLNPSFEDRKDERCLVFLGGFDQMILDWSTPNFGSTDFFNTCSKHMGVKNYNGHQEPKSGNTYAGMYFYTDKNYREYVQGQLSETLTEGEAYKMTFYLSLADQSSFALKDIKVIFTEEKLNPCYRSNSCDKAIKPSSATKKRFKTYSNKENVYFSNKTSWKAYTFEFIAEGYENYFSIGNFYKNSKTKKQKALSTADYFFSYYYIDDVSVIATELIKEELPKIEKSKQIDIKKEASLKPQKTYTFKNVLFDFDKAILLNTSIEELDKLFNYLTENKNLNIEIYGHTDNVGLKKRNNELSLQRAKAVSDYLIKQGLKQERVKHFGFGNSKPILSNDTEENRTKNRRVEFKLIDITKN